MERAVDLIYPHNLRLGLQYGIKTLDSSHEIKITKSGYEMSEQTTLFFSNTH